MEFYVTKRGHRNHQQKKEFEDIDKLDKFVTTQSKSARAIAQALGTPWAKGDVRKLARSPYLYGTDVLSTSRVKKTYQDKFPDLISPYSVAVFDTETDVVNGTNEIIMATISFGKKVYTAVVASFVEGTADVVARAHEALQKYLGSFEKLEMDGTTTILNVLEQRGIEWEFEVVPTEIACVKECIKRAHEWKPDILAMWNIDFDIPRLMEACARANVDPADLFSDPSVPKEYRFFKYKQGSRKKVTASGKEMPIKPADQWHTLYVPASFYVLDGMCVYRKRRVAKGELPSYSLDYILDKELGVRKLKFKQAEGFSKFDWHYEMQSKWKIEYIIYNVFDCVSVEQLDEVTTDLHLGMPLACEMSDFANCQARS
jgi:DNA polymerase elongation subunit (family B)